MSTASRFWCACRKRGSLHRVGAHRGRRPGLQRRPAPACFHVVTRGRGSRSGDGGAADHMLIDQLVEMLVSTLLAR